MYDHYRGNSRKQLNGLPSRHRSLIRQCPEVTHCQLLQTGPGMVSVPISNSFLTMFFMSSYKFIKLWNTRYFQMQYLVSYFWYENTHHSFTQFRVRHMYSSKVSPWCLFLRWISSFKAKSLKQPLYWIFNPAHNPFHSNISFWRWYLQYRSNSWSSNRMWTYLHNISIFSARVLVVIMVTLQITYWTGISVYNKEMVISNCELCS